MALANDSIEQPSAGRLVRAISRRPVVLAGGLAAGLAILAIVLTSQASDGTTPKHEEEEVLLVPDRESAARMRERKLEVAQQKPPSPSSEQAEENLGVHNEVADLPSDALTGPGSFRDKEKAQFEQYLLQVQQEALESRRKARGSSIRVRGFLSAGSDRGGSGGGAEGMGAGAGGLGDGLGGLAEQLGSLGPLAQLGASPALGALGAGGAPYDPSLGGMTGGGGAPGGGHVADPNFLAAKRDFFKNGGQQLEPGRLNASVRPASSPYEVQMGTVIPGVMISGINSEAPGQILGQVSEHVYDSATGKYLLIPQGTRLVGTYSATVAQGQTRVQVAWVRANFPDGSKLDLDGMSGADQSGTSGFNDKVNRHIWAKIGGALLSTAFTVAYEVTLPRNGGFYENAVHRGVGEGIVGFGRDQSQQAAQRPPILEIRPGYRFVIHVNKDVVFRKPYEDGIARRRAR